MKAFGLSLLLLAVVGSALVFLTFTGNGPFTGSVFPARFESATEKKPPKETSYHYPIGTKKRRGLSNINLQDYHPIDPSPGSRASKSGPIEHGTPIMPYLPPPMPPGPPKECGPP
ncbi:hypothetical protein AAC387_Pa03g4217 [Persea americana]